MPVQSGSRLGPYQLGELVGAGGMGEVFRALDTRLNRTVAVKVVRAPFSARFEREARAIAALNHPNICAVHDLGTTDEGDKYLVMEFVEGKPLAGPLPFAEAVRVVRQIARALDAAHRKGIAHRDLKPGNVLMARTGVKLLDFGLAKYSGPAAVAAGSQDITLTADNALVGTLPYMAPELLEGKDADARSDIFALGCVLYELLTGERAFGAETQAGLIADLMKADPKPASERKPGIPPEADAILRRALAKDPFDRWQSAQDMAEALLLVSTAPAPVGVAAPAPGSRVPRRAALIAAVPLLLTAGYFLRRPGSDGVVRRLTFNLTPPAGERIIRPMLSPDGLLLLYTSISNAGARSLVRNMATGATVPIALAEGALAWSPDSRLLLFPRDGKLHAFDVASGAQQELCTCPMRGGLGAGLADWSSGGGILYPHAGGTIHRVSGTTSAAVTVASDGRHGNPRFLAGGNRFLYTTETEIRVSALGSTTVEARIARPARALGILRADPLWIGYTTAAGMEAQRLDRGFQPAGPPLELVRGDIPSASFVPGVIAYNQLPEQGERVVFFSRDGKPGPPIGDTKDMRVGRLAPDGSRVSMVRGRFGESSSLWVLDSVRGTSSRFAEAAGPGGTWSPDSQSLAYVSGGTLLRKGVFSAGGGEPLYRWPAGERAAFPSDWSRDGRFLLLTGPQGISVLSTAAGAKPVSFVAANSAGGGPATFQAAPPQFSPDGKWIAYLAQDDRNQPRELFIADFAGAETPPRYRFQLTHGGAGAYYWHPNGREIMSLVGRSVVSIPLRFAPGQVSAGEPQTLFVLNNDGTLIGVHPDGRVLIALREDNWEPVTVIVNPVAPQPPFDAPPPGSR